MTTEEAKKVIYEMICLRLLTPKEDEALQIAYQALEQQKQKKGKREEKTVFDEPPTDQCQSERPTKKKITLTFFVEEDIGRRLQSDEGLVDSVKHKYYDHIYENGCSNCEVIVETYDPGAVNNNPERKKGKWKMEWHSFFHREVPVCSQCDRAAAYKFDVCPNCGADMREEKDNE